jgi:threonine/homoserine/homoserine lactone efflux protein
MNLSAPKQITFWIAVVLVVIGIVASIVSLGFLSTYALWIVVIGFVVLALGVLIEGL